MRLEGDADRPHVRDVQRGRGGEGFVNRFFTVVPAVSNTRGGPAMHIRSNTTLESNINVTPLVDVCLVLLIIFMIVLPTVVNGIPVKLPIAKGDPAGDLSRQLAITVKDDGTVYIG